MRVGGVRRLRSGKSCQVPPCVPKLLGDGVQLEEKSLSETVLALYELCCHKQAAVLPLRVSMLTSSIQRQLRNVYPKRHVAKR